MARDDIRVIVITGPVGAGKSTTAAALADVLAAAAMPHALIDMDYLRWFSPRPPEDQFGTAVGFANLAAVAATYLATGVRCLVLADVVEHPAAVAQYAAAIPGAVVTVVRLRVPLAVISARLEERHADAAERAWYLARAPELERIMTANGVGDVLIEVGDETPAAVAARIAEKLGLECN